MESRQAHRVRAHDSDPWKRNTDRVVPLTWTLEDLEHVHVRGWTTVGYNYVIVPDGQLRVGRPLWETGAHARGQNQDSIGVCVIGDNTRPIRLGAAADAGAADGASPEHDLTDSRSLMRHSETWTAMDS